MSKTDDGHYELILGNRQLVSGFFVLIILFAIFLTLGYVLGRNSVVVDDTTPQVAQQQPLPAKPRTNEAASRPSAAATSSQGRPDAAGDAAATAPANRPATVPAEPTPTPSAAQSPARDETVVVETRSAADGPANPVAQTPPSKAQQILDSRVRLITPRQGDSFVQVAAVAREDAELMAEQLQRRGYRTFISEVPGRDLFRVLIGPFESNAKLNETKSKLAQEGIETIVQRY